MIYIPKYLTIEHRKYKNELEKLGNLIWDQNHWQLVSI